MERENKNLSVDIPAGIDNGDRIALRSQGCDGKNGGPAGDLIIQISVQPHKIFKRNGYNIYCDIPITISEAVLGAEIEVPTLEGTQKFELPEGTQTGTSFTLRGKGIPYVGYKNRGDQYVTVVVETPTKLTREQKDLLKKLAETMDDDAQPKRRSFFDKLKDQIS